MNVTGKYTQKYAQDVEKMGHSIKRLTEGIYYKHSVPRYKSYPWDVSRQHWRRVSKDEVKRRLHDVQQKKMDTAAEREPKK